MSGEERLAEAGHILARGVIRAVEGKSSQIAADYGDSLVDLSTDRSGHAASTTARKA
jgi:hypothetical protein